MVYSLAGMASTIFLDLDTNRGGVQAVTKDAERLRTWFGHNGAQWVEDVSPNGGRHLYLPLAEAIPFTEARDFVEALERRFTTIDPSPHRSVASGCCRVPGSTHRTGGVQKLTQVVGEAILAVSERNAPVVWARLWADTTELRTSRNQLEPYVPEEIDSDQLVGLSSQVLRIAREGIYDQARYRSPSEARMAVIAGAVRQGMTVTDVQQKMLTGAWPALAGLYSKYAPGTRSSVLAREWRKAHEFIARSLRRGSGRSTQRNVHRSDTSKNKSQGVHAAPAHKDFLEAWSKARSALEQRLRGSKDKLGLRMMLRALEEASAKTGTREISFGVRAYALATGAHPSTAAAQLQLLTATPGAPIRKISDGRGRDADTYELTLPEVSNVLPGRRRRVHAVRPAFRELGLPAAFVYEELENAQTPLRVAELVQATGLGRSTIHQALETLASWGLARWKSLGWVVGSACLKVCAEVLGVIEAVIRQQALYKKQRARWHAWLESRQHPGLIPEVIEEYPYWLFEPDEEPEDRAQL
ncbi:helix-turn-helix domain-containing protein [Arthrobacter sp. 18067]|uniref:helix-turn-helix domain-containing protein n=1 Tax=Arthrobacter sp. 18067 TaxID=2681413 RepID=UPI001356A7F4